MKRLAILTSGGDAPGMNAGVRAATLLGLAKGCEVLGVEQGYQGLLDGRLRPLQAADVSGIIRDGGTILGSARCLEFIEKTGRDRARRVITEAGIDGLLVIGGNGSLTGMTALIDPNECGDLKLDAVGIPASIDNDVGLTRLAIGVDTAMNTIVDACDRISDTASAHDRTFIVEVMGRDCGYLAMTSAIASAADAVLFPEAEKSEDEIVNVVAKAVLAAQKRQGRTKRVVVIKAEGVAITNDRLREMLDDRLKKELGDRRGSIETRVTVLGHVVRGGRPSAFDRLLASRLANAAVAALLMGESRYMVAWMAPELPQEVAKVSPTDPQCSLISMDAVLKETRAMIDGTSPFVQWRKKAFAEIEDVLSL